MVYAAEENGEDLHFGRQIINLEVEDKILVGHGANARPNFCVFRAPVGIRNECSHIDKGLVDPGRRALDSTLEAISKFLVTLDEMFLNEVKVACDIRRAADRITSHSY
jgi:hypothetical protein